MEASPCPSLRRFTWEEIREHAKPFDCWVVYEGKVFDVTDFVPNHPGGRAIWWQGGGRDITILFNISHPPRVTEEYLWKYGRHLGYAEGVEIEGAPEYDWSSPFWCELKDKCWAKLNDLVRHKAGYEEGKFAKVTYGEWDVDLYFSLLILMYLSTLLFCMCPPAFVLPPNNWWTDSLTWARMLVALVFVGPLAGGVSLVMHEARHRDNGFIWYSPMDLSGVSSLRYMIEHSWHHNWPNLPDDEIEMDLFAFAPGMRHFPWQPHRFWHRFQWLYWPISLGLVVPSTFITDVKDFWMKGRIGKLHRSWTSWTETVMFCVGKLVQPLLLVLPVWYGEFKAGSFSIQPYLAQCIIFGIFAFMSSFWVSLFNIPAHLGEDELDEAGKQYSDFAKTQIAHSRTFGANSRLTLWVLQGINTQTEHHLFPTVPFKYLMDLTPIVVEVCEKYNVQFNDPYVSFSHAMKLYLGRVFRLAKADKDTSSEKVAAAPDHTESTSEGV